jgi:glyoxylase-like metal-dependent hydrolase (beta-lactamase superfamily II)
MRFYKISESIYANTEAETGGNVGIVLLNNRVVAIDSKYPVTGADFRRSIPSITMKPVTHLLLTHYHGDHVFGIQAFEDCKIVAHRLLKEKMEENLKTVWAPGNLEKMIADIMKNRPSVAGRYKGLKIVLPNKTFKEQFIIDGVKMIHMPGHTADSSVVHMADDQILFAGDLIFAKSFPWGGDPTANPDAWIQSFRRILKMEIKTIVPGHGPVCDKLEVKTQLKWFEAMRKEMKNLIHEDASLEEAVKHDDYPTFYDAERQEWRENTIRHWYNFWSQKQQKQNFLELNTRRS